MCHTNQGVQLWLRVRCTCVGVRLGKLDVDCSWWPSLRMAQSSHCPSSTRALMYSSTCPLSAANALHDPTGKLHIQPAIGDQRRRADGASTVVVPEPCQQLLVSAASCASAGLYWPGDCATPQWQAFWSSVLLCLPYLESKVDQWVTVQ